MTHNKKLVVIGVTAAIVVLGIGMALATERHHGSYNGGAVAAPSVTALGGSGGAGGLGGAGGAAGDGGSVNSRTTAIGTSSSANNGTCLSPWLSGLLNERDVACDLRRSGFPKAAVLSLCANPDVRKALAASKEGLTCPPEGDQSDPYIRMRTAK